MTAFFILMALLGAPGLFAQSSGQSGNVAPAEVSDQELQQFAEALENVRSIREEMVQETQGLVADSSLEESRFQEMYRAENGGPAPSEEPTAAEEEEFTSVMEEIQTIQQESNQAMISAVEDEGLGVQRFNQIAQAIQQSPELQQRFQATQNQS